jgi:hypothetical protein
MKKILLIFFIFLYQGVMVISQEHKAVPYKTKSGIKVIYPSTGDTVLKDTICLIRWTRTGLQNKTVKIIIVKPISGQKWTIAEAAPNNGKYIWNTGCWGRPNPGAYKMKIKGGNLVNKGGLFNLIKPALVLTEPQKNQILKVGTLKTIKWLASDAEGVKVNIFINVEIGGFSKKFQLANNVPGNQKQWHWVVGKYNNNSLFIWDQLTDTITKSKCFIEIFKEPTITQGCFIGDGPSFYMFNTK